MHLPYAFRTYTAHGPAKSYGQPARAIYTGNSCCKRYILKRFRREARSYCTTRAAPGAPARPSAPGGPSGSPAPRTSASPCWFSPAPSSPWEPKRNSSSGGGGGSSRTARVEGKRTWQEERARGNGKRGKSHKFGSGEANPGLQQQRQQARVETI